MDLLQNSPDDSFVYDESQENFIKSLKSSQIPTTELFLSSVFNISKKLNWNENDVRKFIQTYETETNQRLQKKLHKLSAVASGDVPYYFTVGDESIDKALNGGIPVNNLIEVSGKSSSGKSNFLLNLSVTIQLPKEFGGLGPSIFDGSNEQNDVATLYIPTESLLPTSRILQIIDNYTELLKTNGILDSSFFPKLDNFMTTSKPITTLEEQDHILRYQLPAQLMRNKGIKMIIIDSITHHLRAELDYNKQVDYIRSICKHLKDLIKRFNVTIVVANQVTDKPINGIFEGDNEVLLKLNLEYQMAWMLGWDDFAILYRQLIRRKGVIDEAGKSFEKLDYLDNLKTGLDSNEENSDVYSEDNLTQKNQRNDLKNILKMERKKMFENSYKNKVSGITTRPALGLPLLESIDMRIILKKEYEPILDENLIDEFSAELGINTNSFSQKCEDDSLLENSLNNNVCPSDPIETSTQTATQKQIVSDLANNNYLNHYNFQTFRSLTCVFGPLIPAGESRKVDFEIWKGGVRKYNR